MKKHLSVIFQSHLVLSAVVYVKHREFWPLAKSSNKLFEFGG